MVHRDIKPQNILIMADGGVQITDLGCAIRADEEEDHKAAYVDTEITGTPDYHCPEYVAMPV